MNESGDLKHYRRSQLDSTFKELKKGLPPRPKKGWIAEVRSLLLMTTAQLARRVGVAQSVVSNFEKSERKKAITLQSLERIAEALECELHYFLVPKKGLDKTLNERAKKLYEHDQKVVEHQMRLEGQGTKTDLRRDIEIAMLIANRHRRIWDDTL